MPGGSDAPSDFDHLLTELCFSLGAFSDTVASGAPIEARCSALKRLGAAISKVAHVTEDEGGPRGSPRLRKGMEDVFEEICRKLSEREVLRGAQGDLGEDERLGETWIGSGEEMREKKEKGKRQGEAGYHLDLLDMIDRLLDIYPETLMKWVSSFCLQAVLLLDYFFMRTQLQRSIDRTSEGWKKELAAR